MKRLFKHDPAAGITSYFHYDDATDKVTIETVQTLDAILEQNLRRRNNQTSLDRWGDGKIVASIPAIVHAELLASGKYRDQAYMRRWLNDPDNKKYRIFQGKV